MHGLTKTPEYRLFLQAKARAKQKGIPFNLEIKDIIIPTNCPVLGIALKRGGGKPCRQSPSVDKIRPELGYVRGNVRVISWRANLLKSNGTAEELRLVAEDAERLSI